MHLGGVLPPSSQDPISPQGWLLEVPQTTQRDPASGQGLLTRPFLPRIGAFSHFRPPAWHWVLDATPSLLALAVLVYRNTLMEARKLTPALRCRETASHHLLCRCFRRPGELLARLQWAGAISAPLCSSCCADQQLEATEGGI